MSDERNPDSENPHPERAPGAFDLAAFIERMGEEAVRQRWLKQAELVANPKVGHLTLEAFGHHLSLEDVAIWSTKLLGLYDRGYRNYLEVRVVESEVRLERLPEALDGLRILQLTDLHTDMAPGFADVVVERIRDLEYDLCLVTGDYRESTYADYDESVRLTAKVVAAIRGPRFGILGNHDFLEMVPGLEAAGLPFLLNEEVTLDFDGERIHLAGVDDPDYYETADTGRVTRRQSEGAVSILMAHSPRAYRDAARAGFDFMLSGHTHGGQICLPGGFAIVRNGKSPGRMLAGPWSYRELVGYTSRGTGASGVPLRFNCPSEVVVHVLRRA